jgi:hypothetical protein
MSGDPAPAVVAEENTAVLGTYSTWSAAYLTPRTPFEHFLDEPQLYACLIKSQA